MFTSLIKKSIVLAGLLGAFSINHAFKVFDGQPKLIFHGNGQSWQINDIYIKQQLGLAGVDHAMLTVVTHDGGYNSFPVGEDGKIGGWALDPNWPKNVRKNNPASTDLIMIINVGDKYGEEGAGGSAQIDLVVKRMLLVYDYFTSHGAKEVLFANGHYLWSRYRGGNPNNTNTYTGSIAILKEYTKRTGRPCGDVWTPSKGYFPYHVGQDFEHGADLLKALYGQVYAKMLLEYDSLQTAQAQAAWNERDAYLMAKEKALRDRATVEFTANPANNLTDVGSTIKGVISLHRDKMATEYKTKAFSAYVLLMAHQYGNTLATFIVSDTFSLASDVSPFSITIPEFASVEQYAPAGRNYCPVLCDSFRVCVKVGIAGGGHDKSFGSISHQLSAPYLFKRTATALRHKTDYRELRAVPMRQLNSGLTAWPYTFDLQGRRVLGQTQASEVLRSYSSESILLDSAPSSGTTE